MKRLKSYLFNVLLSIDQLGNTLFLGDPDETISSRMGKWKLRRMRSGQWPPGWYHPLYWLERGLDKIDPNHVIGAIEEDEGEGAVEWKMKVPR